MATERKLTGKQEAFCQGLASGLNQSDAYRQAGYSDNGLPATLINNAHALATRSDIVARVAELRESLQAQRAQSREDYPEEVWTNVDDARGRGQLAASNGALTIAGKILGHLVDWPQPIAPINVTHVTYILNHGKATPPSIVDGTGAVVEGAGKVVDDEKNLECAPN